MLAGILIFLLAITAIPIILALMVFHFSIPFALYYRIRRKRYSPVKTALFYIVITIIITIIQGITISIVSKRYSIACAPVPFLLDLASVYVIGYLPVTKSRSRARPWLKDTGVSKYLSIMLQYNKLRLAVLVILCILISLFITDPGHGLTEEARNFNIVFLSSCIIIALFFLHKKVSERVEAKEHEVIFDPTKDSYILYLRSFNVEVDIFAMVWQAKYKDQYARCTFEEFFSDAANARIGPLIALGSPIDSWLDNFMWRNKDNARREYFDDKDWKTNLDIKLDKCTAIFLYASVTEHIDHELREILRKGHTAKLFIFTKPALTKKHGYIVRFWNWVKATPAYPWRSFSELLVKSGYELPFDEPPSGSVISFDSRNRAYLLRSGLTQPEEYIHYVKAWLSGPR